MPIVSKVNGDIIKLAKAGKYTAIVHGANCFCAMGAGLAPQIAKAWPGAEEVDNDTVRGDKSKLGKYTLYSTGYFGVINAYTQYGTAGRSKGVRDVSYKAIAEVFGRINDSCKNEVGVIGIPLIGADRGGGHWEAIETIINLVTPDVTIELVKYDPTK